MRRVLVPTWAADYPETAQTIAQICLPFYCINCLRKKETAYLTPNFGPVCDECLRELKTAKL